MLNRPEPACLVIADLSGYTGYLAAVELDHAQDILADLIDTVVGALRPTFRLAKLEPVGDDRTLVQFRFARPRSAKDRAFLEAVLPQIAPQFQAGLASLVSVLSEEMERRRAEGALPEPEVPASAGRFLSEPVNDVVDSTVVRSSSS